MALNRYFIDSNILIRHLTQDNQTLSPKATSFIEEIAKEEAIGFVTSLVVHEVIYILVYVYKVNRKGLVNSLKKLLKLKNLEILDIDKKSLSLALDDFAKFNIDFPDCVYKQIALNNNLEILTFDKDFKKIKK
ncbi:hypothetical protein A3H26_00125 [candidate division WWE3 bacterium RIFCSPLOWO2_12_FULL_36_10]|uniref:PIN domain-containing protein n=1 Tax=candidate division WWE3 bacterium RIFCSPLOWO2_12_FULL_36_10 TaxID=1802630 RepID=A0A1F4VIC8_UNCKA|nr:MAG: hypothetical protein A3H26_00125 [candidate division WWE3 bacterium RIFCSPLOWO2_12_FULL_36_10]